MFLIIRWIHGDSWHIFSTFYDKVTEKIYEEYGRLTVKHSENNSSRFFCAFKLIMDFIDNNSSFKKQYDSNLFKKLQEIINEKHKREFD